MTIARIAGNAGARNAALDGLRGLAALAVAVGHCNLAVTGLDLWGRTVRDLAGMSAEAVGLRLLYLVAPSDAAVTLFFVLSGHVLWESFLRGRPGPAEGPDYLVGRAYRLLPVAIASALPLGLILNASAGELVANMLLLSTSMNGVLWSLQTEVLCSLALFGAWLLAGDSRARLVALLLAVLVAAPAFRGSNLFLFFPAFLLGALVGACPGRIWARRSTLVAGLALLTLASFVLSHGAVARPFEMLGAAVVIACLRARPPALLCARPILFLGAVSYPFYLCHTTGLELAVRLEPALGLADPVARVAVLALLSIPVALALAWFLHVAVERPAMRVRPRLRQGRAAAPPPYEHAPDRAPVAET
jgi:peptidoglycan/LPS O-acetylase OafA/YrhL